MNNDIKKEDILEFLRVHLKEELYKFILERSKDMDKNKLNSMISDLCWDALKKAVEMTRDKTQKEYFDKYFVGCESDFSELPTFNVLIDEKILEDHFSEAADEEFFMLEQEFDEVIHHFLDICGMPITFHEVDREEEQEDLNL